MSAQVQEGVWLPLLEYAHKKGLSLSTLRRYIKADKVTYRLEKGKYRVWDPMGNASSEIIVEPVSGQSLDHLKMVERVSFLETELAKARSELKYLREEAVELKMLIAFYEESPVKAPTPSRSL